MRGPGDAKASPPSPPAEAEPSRATVAAGGGPVPQPPATDAALHALLLALADDELIAGHRASEWTGVAPFLEEDVAFSSIAQDEVGHAALLYRLLADLGHGGGDPDALAFGRGPEAFRNAVLLEAPNGDWAAEIARHFLYSEYEAVIWPALANSPYAPLAAAAARIAREEAYHRAHFRQWVVALGRAGGEARDRLRRALARALPLAAGFFEPLEDEDRAAYWRGITLAELEARWRAEVHQVLKQAGLAEDGSDGSDRRRGPGTEPGDAGPGSAGGFAGPGAATSEGAPVQQATDGKVAGPPAGAAEGGGPGAGRPGFGGRRGQHSPALAQLLEEMTSVYRSEPGAAW